MLMIDGRIFCIHARPIDLISSANPPFSARGAVVYMHVDSGVSPR